MTIAANLVGPALVATLLAGTGSAHTGRPVGSDDASTADAAARSRSGLRRSRWRLGGGTGLLDRLALGGNHLGFQADLGLDWYGIGH